MMKCGTVIVVNKPIAYEYKTRSIIICSRETTNILNMERKETTIREYGIISLEDYNRYLGMTIQGKEFGYSVMWVSEDTLLKEYEEDTWGRVCKEKGL